jgi:regulator of sirC expression with transglutaminase-like and TPR domain
VDLVRIGLEIACDAYPDLDPEPYLATIEALAERVRGRCTSLDRPRAVLRHINWVLFIEEGFRGNRDEYYDPRNSYLNDVMERKTGIPITLSLLYARLAERLGLAVGGLCLPAHFMLRVEAPDGPILVDPYHAGEQLDRAECQKRIGSVVGRELTLSDDQLVACPPDQVVARMLYNLKSIYLGNHDYASALPVQQRLAALLNEIPGEQRDLAIILLHLDRPDAAVGPLEAYLGACPDSPDSSSLDALLRAARRELALRN